MIAILAASSACVAPPRTLERRGLDAAWGEVDHSIWNRLVQQHVRDGVVDYPALCSEPGLRRYVDRLATARTSATEPLSQRLAVLINGYNALVVSQVCSGRTPATLLGRYRFFWRERFAIGGESITLWDLEHERIRPLGEPRIHFALVCASASCPALRSEAYLPETLDMQLDDAARRFLADPTRNRIDLDAGLASLSAIFDWYEDDFLATEPTIAVYISRYVDDPPTARALEADRLRVEWLPYDWSTNGPVPHPAAR